MYQLHNVFILSTFYVVSLVLRLTVHLANICLRGRGVWSFEAIVWGRLLSILFIFIALATQVALKSI